MKLGLIFAACLLIAGCGAAESVDSSAVPGNDSGSSTSTGDSATGTSSGDDGGIVPPGDDGGTTTGDSASSGGDDSSTTVDSGTGGDDGGSPAADSGSSGGDDGGSHSSDSGTGGGDDGGGATTDSGSSGGDDGGSTVADSGNGGSSDSGRTGDDSGSCHAHSCVYTQGFYKNHTSNWTVLPVVMGTNSYDQAACLGLLNDPSTGDASIILAKQFIAAVENGGWCDSNASALLSQAQQWFTTNQNGMLPYGIDLPDAGCGSDHSSVPCRAYWLGQSLDSYNNGLSGTPACQ